MNFPRPLATPLCLAAAVSIAACGGGGGSSPANPPAATPNPDPVIVAPPTPAAPAPVTVTAIGTITGFGSVFVNGRRYEIAPSTVVAVEDGIRTGDDSELRMGMKVRISADDDDGARTATRIDYDDDVEGPIESISPNSEDPTVGTFVILGQTIEVVSRTTFDNDVGNNDGNPGVDFRDLEVGMIVEVSGYPSSNGFLATRIDRDDDGDDDDFELEGFVEAVADDLSSVTVSGIEFLVTSDTELDDDIVIGPELVGAYVDIEAELVGGEYIAIEIDREDDLYADDDQRNDHIEIEGVLQAADAASTPNSFTINGATIETVDASALERLVGSFVEIEGEFNDDGLFVIDEVEREVEENVDTSDNVASIDTDNGHFTTRLGLQITPTGASRVEDDTTDDDIDDRLTPDEFIGRLQVGDRIDAEGFDNGSGEVVWTSVEREAAFMDNDESDCSLTGPVESVSSDASNFSLVIQGVSITTGRMADDDFEVDDGDSGRAVFFDALEVGSIVEADSFDGAESCMSGMMDAEELELDEPDDGFDD